MSDNSRIPSSLMKHVLVVSAGALFLFAISLIFTISTGQYRFGFAGMVIALCVAGYAALLFRNFSKKRYVTIDGICIDARMRGKFRGRTWQIVLEDTGSKDVYGFETSALKKYRILPGDRLYLYMPEDSLIAEHDGILSVINYYGYEIHR